MFTVRPTLLASAFLLFFTSPLLSQFLPVIATQTRGMYEVRTDGTEAPLQEEIGIFLRARDGSKLTRWKLLKNGIAQGEGIGTLTNGQNGFVHRIDYDAKLAKQTQKLPTPLQPSRRDMNKSTGQQMINGLLCQGFPMKVNGKPDGGTVWISIENDLIVKMEWTFRTGTKLMHAIEELSSVHLGADPDPTVFMVPTNFFVTGLPH